MGASLRLITLPTGTGFGDAAHAYAEGLAEHGMGLEVSTLAPTRSGPWADLAVEPGPSTLLGNPALVGDDEVLLLSLPPMDGPRLYERCLARFAARRRVVYTTWEQDRLPTWYVAVLNRFDQVIVPSEFNRRVFEASGVTAPVAVIPHLVRTLTPTLPELPQELAERFLFYTIGTWTTRKAMAETVLAFLEAFDADDPVALLVKTSPEDQVALAQRARDTARNWPRAFGATWWTVSQLVRSRRRPASVHLMTEPLDAAQIAGLHQQCDCFVSLTHGEGWGLCSFEAAQAGKPSVITGWGGQVDYLGMDYPWYVDYELRASSDAPADLHTERSSELRWAYADRAHAATLLRQAVADRAGTVKLGEQLRQRVHQQSCRQEIIAELAALLGLSIR